LSLNKYYFSLLWHGLEKNIIKKIITLSFWLFEFKEKI
jgi:hypothetical protein